MVIDPKTGLTFEQAQKQGVRWTAPAGAYDSPTTTTAPTTTTTTTQTQQTPQDIISSAYKTLEEASKITGIPVDYSGKITPIQDTQLTDTSMETPSLPQEQDYDAYFGSLEQQYQQQRLTLESAYQKQIDDARVQQDKAREEMQKYEEMMKSTLDQADPTQRSTWEQEQRVIQNKLDAAEAASETIQENFMANQQSIGELETLLTDAMRDIQSAKSVTGLGTIRYPRIKKVEEDYQAREGIIRSVMAARDNQIGQAHNIIDSAMNNIKSNWNEQLTYYNAVLGFYDKLRDEEGNKLINLERDEKNYINAQIGLIENDMARAQESADYIKQMMMDPSTAGMMEAAGVKITDTPQQIQAKLAQYQYSEELRELSNKMSEGGATRITAEQAATLGEGQVITQTDTKGNVSYWKVPMSAGEAPQIIGTEKTGYHQWNSQTGQWEPTGIGGPGIDSISSSLELILRGHTNLNDLTPTEKNKVQTEALNAGFYNEIPIPEFVEEIKKTSPGISDEDIKREWDIYREPLVPRADFQIDKEYIRAMYPKDQLLKIAWDAGFITRKPTIAERLNPLKRPTIFISIEAYLDAKMEEIERDRMLGLTEAQIYKKHFEQ